MLLHSGVDLAGILRDSEADPEGLFGGVGCGELFFIKPGVNVDGQYCCDIVLSQRMLDAIEHVVDVDDNFFVFQQDIAPMRCTCNKVQLLQQETLNFLYPDL